ncbi:glycosyltransferase [Christiangramia sp. SM2212]|uniref:Glycosyltransferase n=1 Tax=Christiangramia sediminicola TaxID=3073267 RepID=A0ABU1EQD2_9FLAO|nr:glycosyltransferase [Christiangramia sp. SM2212]MDR5590571.1 glycosyltransferase [Christiangramia sp. SM2212]
MKILQIIHKPQNRGAETFTCQLSSHLIAEGHRVKIVSIYDGNATLPGNFKIESLGGKLDAKFFDFAAWKKLNKIVLQYKPDMVQVNAGDSLKYTVFSKFVFRWNRPIVVRNASEVGQYIKSNIQKNINRFFYKNIRHVASVSEASKKDIKQLFPFLEDKISVIPIGLEPIHNIPKIDLGETRNIVHIGGFTFEKNHTGLIRIFENVFEKNGNVKLHLVGDGPLRSEIENLVRSKGLEKNVVFHGFVNNPLSYAASSELLVLPSIIEGLPGVILEAMYCKTPVIAYNVGGVSEVLNESSGYLITKGNEIDFANTINEILKCRPISKIEHAYQLVLNSYMNKEITRKFIKVYKTVVSQ